MRNQKKKAQRFLFMTNEMKWNKTEIRIEREKDFIIFPLLLYNLVLLFIYVYGKLSYAMQCNVYTQTNEHTAHTQWLW